MWGDPRPIDSGSRQILFRGYIGNREELADRLREDEPERVEDDLDAALFAKAHERWAERLNEHVLGEYALAVFVPETRTLFLTRDGIGIQPLFYAVDGRGVWFASHLEELLRAVDPGEPDEVFLGEHLLFGPYSFERTAFRNVSRMRPGRSLSWRSGELTDVASWELSQVRPVRLPADRDYEARFVELLVEGVRQALPAGRKALAELSGGLDSSSIVGAARAGEARRLETISFVYPGYPEADESAWIRLVVEKNGFPAHELDAGESLPFSELPAEFYGEPNLVLAYRSVLRRYERLAEALGTEVVLSGNGGDHVMVGDCPFPLQLADDLAALRFRQLWSGLRDWQQNELYRRPLQFLFRRFALEPCVRYRRGEEVTPRFLIRTPPWVSREILRRLAERPRPEPPSRGQSPSDQYFLERVWDVALLTGANWHQAVRSIEIRYPLLFRPLVEFLYAIPWDQKLSPRWDRFLQRRALRSILPRRIRVRTDKVGPTQPVVEGLRAAEPWLEMLANHPRLVDLGFVEPGLWSESVRRARAGQPGGVSSFIAAATLECWLRSLDRRPAAEPDLRAAAVLR